MKPPKWSNADAKLFPYQVGFTSPPVDFDAAPSDFLRIAPAQVGVIGRIMHLPGYRHELCQRSHNFHLLEDVAACLSDCGADVMGQVGTNWVHCNGTDVSAIRAFCARLTETYATPFLMAGLCLVDALQALNVSRIAVNTVYYWPDWRDGIVGFLRGAGFEIVYAGNFVDQGLYETQQQVNAQHWIFPGELALASMSRALQGGAGAEAVVVTGMPNWRRADGLPQRTLALAPELEAELGVPVVASDLALYWAIFRSLGIAPRGRHGRVLALLG